MADKPDPLIESLMALAVSAAPLIERARASGMFKPGSREAASAAAAADVVTAPAAAPVDDFAAQKSALQDIIVAQAMKIAALEAEVATLKAKK
jgi:hypothetical protein